MSTFLCKVHRIDSTNYQCDQPACINTDTAVYTGVLRKSPVKRLNFCDFAHIIASAMVLNAHLFAISRINEVFRAPWQKNESDDNSSNLKSLLRH